MISFPSLRIQTIDANLTIEKRDPQMLIEGQIGELVIEKRDHSFQVQQTEGKLYINNYAVNKQLNFKNVMDLSMDFASESKQKSFEAISEYAGDGDQLMKIENKGASPIPDIAERNYLRFIPADINIAYFPEPPIEINYQPGNVTSDYMPGEVSTDIVKKLNIEAQLGEVKTYATYPQVNIDVVGNNLDYEA